MRRAYHPGFGSVVNYTVEPLSQDPDAQVEKTVQRIIQYICEDSQHPAVLQEARRAVALGGGDPILGVWRLLKRSVQFQDDVQTAVQLQTHDLENGEVVEVLIRPADQALLIQLRGMGIEDCDGFTMYGACLLTALGYRTALATVAADPTQPWKFSHVYLIAYKEDGTRIPLDLSHGPYPGWEVGSTRFREWPVQAAVRPSAGRVLGFLAVAGAALVGIQYWNRRAA